MTMKIETNTDARNALGSAIDAAQSKGEQLVGTTAPVVVALVHLLRTSNNMSATIAFGEGDKGDSVTFTAANLASYARGALPTKKANASDTLPTPNQMLAALASLSPKVQAAKEAKARADNAAKKSKKASVKTKQASLAENAERALNTAKQPLRRALPIAAFLVNAADDYDLSSVCTDGASVMATEYDDEGNAGETVAITSSMAREEFKDDTRKAHQNDTDATETKDETAATVTAESVRKGGDARANLAPALQQITAHLAALDGAPNMAERKALQELWAQIGSMLDDDAIVEASEKQAS